MFNFEVLTNLSEPHQLLPITEAMTMLREKMKSRNLRCFHRESWIIKKCTLLELHELFSEKLGGVFQFNDWSLGILPTTGGYIYVSMFSTEQTTITWMAYGTAKQEADKWSNWMEQVLEPLRLTNIMMADIKWFYSTKGQQIDHRYLAERLDDVVHPEAYPYIPNVDDYINSYLTSPERLLILKGAPGTGKTRFIRYLIKRLGILKKQKAVSVVFTADDAVLSDDIMFITFTCDGDDIMVLEDIDYHLQSRKEGNVNMYKLLNVSDSILSGAQNKIVVSTNLTNIREVDSALLRPGRCYDVLQFRALTYQESITFLKATRHKKKELPKERDYLLSELYRITRGQALGSGQQQQIGFAT